MSRFAGLKDALAKSAVEDDPEIPDPDAPDEDDEDCPSTSKKKDTPMTEDELKTAKAESHAEGFQAANARMTAVFASEHFAGRETLAQTLLGKALLSADDIIDVLATAPKAPAAAAVDTDAQDRAAMRDALAAEQPAPIADAAGAGDLTADAKEKAAAGWAKATEFANANAGL